jgi:translation initiation factor 2 subunit 3
MISIVSMKFTKLKRNDIPERAITENEPLILSIGTATVLGFVVKAKRDNIEVRLKHPVCADSGTKVAIMRNFAQRWKLSGYGVI